MKQKTASQIRQDLIRNIKGINSYLKGTVQQMMWLELLANCHPIERYDAAWRLYQLNIINSKDLEIYAPKKSRQ